MFLRECKCTIVTILSVLILRFFAVGISWKVFLQDRGMCHSSKTDPSNVLIVDIMNYSDRG